MAELTIEGRKVLTGTHRVSGNKNAALPMIAAALLTREPVTLENLPAIADVEAMLEAAKFFGVKIRREGPDQLILEAARFPRDVSRPS